MSMNTTPLRFRRVFAQTMYKNLKLPLGEMSFSKDFVKDTRGDLYPVIHAKVAKEEIRDNRYMLKSGTVERLLGGFFPYATYEMTASADGEWGFTFYIPAGKVRVVLKAGAVVFTDNERAETVACPHKEGCTTLIVTCRPGAFDLYFPKNGKPQFFHTFHTALFADAHCENVFREGYVTVTASGCVTVDAVSFYIDCGISQADMRPIRYENGDVLIENGKVYLSLTVRTQENSFQGIVAWIPSTAHFELTGALFYDSGDNYWCGDVAASILYNRPTKEWYLWVCSFAHDHILGHATFTGDPRFGVNVIDIALMPKGDTTASVTDFVGFEGDEDPDFYFDEDAKKWYMAICRLDPALHAYRYVFFSSDRPFDGYTCIGKGADGAETGGSFVCFEGERVFACGNDFAKRADYRIYAKDGMKTATFDFDDGGFRGWGTIIPVTLGSRKRYFWMTFDRHNASDYNWSYGNVYCFEGIV